MTGLDYAYDRSYIAIYRFQVGSKTRWSIANDSEHQTILDTLLFRKGPDS